MSLITKEFTLHGFTYKALCQDAPWDHPSQWSHVDEDIVRRRVWFIEAGSVVFDVGAAYGSYGLSALAQGAAHVYAWSPQGHPGDPMGEGAYLKESLKLNGWENRMTIWEKSGVYRETGWFETSTATFVKELSAPPGPWVLRVQAIDTLKLEDGSDFEWPGRLDWMKLDVEGAEVPVLEGAAKTIARYRPRIAVENHNFLVPGVEGQVRSLLEGWGYKHDHTAAHGSVSHSLYLP